MVVTRLDPEASLSHAQVVQNKYMAKCRRFLDSHLSTLLDSWNNLFSTDTMRVETLDHEFSISQSVATQP